MPVGTLLGSGPGFCPLTAAFTIRTGRLDAHVPFKQKRVLPEHALVQLPQCVGVFSESVQPAAGSPHAPKPVAHCGLQVPAAQLVLPALTLLQATAQLPQ
jgi:hypothetical protein